MEAVARRFMAPLNHTTLRLADTATTASSMLLSSVSNCCRPFSRFRKLISRWRAVLSRLAATAAISSPPDSGKPAERFPAAISYAAFCLKKKNPVQPRDLVLPVPPAHRHPHAHPAERRHA